MLVAHLAAAAAGAILLLAVAGREVRARLWAARASARLSAVSRYRHEMLAFVGHSAVRASLKVVTRRFDLILLGHFRSPAEVGTYGAALRLAQVMEEISDPLYFAAFPQLARAWVEARDEFFRLLRLMAAGLAVLTSAVVAVGRGRGAADRVPRAGPDLRGGRGTLPSPPFRHRRRSRDALGHARDARERTPRGGDGGRDGRGRGPRRPARGPRADLGSQGAAWARVGGALGYLAVVLPWLVRRAKRRALRLARSAAQRVRSVADQRAERPFGGRAGESCRVRSSAARADRSSSRDAESPEGSRRGGKPESARRSAASAPSVSGS